MINTQDDMHSVNTSIGEIKLLTYEILGENPNPVFHSRYGVAYIYPYTLQDDIASTPTDKVYRTLTIENKYLRVTVLPELGGRVYSVYDKISERDVFYKNSIIKFSPLAIRGAFFSGGVEFSFPVAHAPTTAESVNWDIIQEGDGSASICIGGLEHISGMRWTIKLSLFPNRCALAQDVSLFNPTPIPGRYHYWTNASLDSDDQTEFIYPFHRVRSYEFPGTASWPVARLDLIKDEPGLPGMEGVPMWPTQRLHKPFNFRWENNMLAQVSIFGRNVTWDFFGAWQHSSNTGYAHYAHHTDVAGMKLWSWGRSEVGIINQTALTDDGSLYAETQCGAMETQLDFDFLQPGTTRTWREWWLPLRELGGLTCASEHVGARLHITKGENDDQVNLLLGICPVYFLEAAKIRLSIPDIVLLEEIATVSPEQPWMNKLAVESGFLAAHPINITVTDDKGYEILNYTHFRDTGIEDTSRSLMVDSIRNAEYYFQLGIKYENFDDRPQALKSYYEALRLDDQHALSHFNLGLMLLRSCDFRSASNHFHQAFELGVHAAGYYLGLISWYLGESETAEIHYLSVPINDESWLSAQRGLASIALKRGDFAYAIDILNKIVAECGENINLNCLLAIAIRYAGQFDKAIGMLEQIIKLDPLNHIILRELSLLDHEKGMEYTSRLERLLADDKQYTIDMAVYYLDAGLLADSISILEKSIVEWDYPLLCYLAEYVCQSLGQHEKAKQLREKGQQGDPDFVFPSRLWEVIALEDTLSNNPHDYKASYYLANFKYAHQRFNEAVQLWEQACVGLDSFDVIHRNLGLAYWHQMENPEKAIEEFERALSINPNNQDIYIHLDDIYNQLNDEKKRSELLKLMLKLDPIREDLRKRTLKMMVELGNYETALQKLTEEKFVPLEMDQSFHEIYTQALLQRAKDHMEANRIKQAIDDYLHALDFPRNQGVGRPMTMHNAEIHFRLGCAYELLGKYQNAIHSWKKAIKEHHEIRNELFPYIQKSLDKLGRYSELGFHI